MLQFSMNNSCRMQTEHRSVRTGCGIAVTFVHASCPLGLEVAQACT